MNTYNIIELVEIARKKSPFYQHLYKDIGSFSGKVSQLPIVPESKYWQSNSFHNNQLLTDQMQGILLRTGGTTGIPKVSIFSTDEWQTLCQITVDKLCETGLLKSGDHVANMFMSGNLYGSFLLMSGALRLSKFPVLELPIGRHSITTSQVVCFIKELKATVIMGTPYCLIAVAAFMKANNIKGIHLNRFLYGGDTLLDSQYLFLKKLFPNAIISSAGYASTDSGFLGYSDQTCKLNEYRIDNQLTYVEIIDIDTNLPIQKENKPGFLVVTNLTRILAPVIRYPVGDLAMWIEKDRKIKLLGRYGRDYDLIEVGDKKLRFQDFYDIIKKSNFCNMVLGFQIYINKKNGIKLQIALDYEENDILEQVKYEINQLFVNYFSIYSEASWLNTQINCEFIDISQLKYDARTYKMIKIIRE